MDSRTNRSRHALVVGGSVAEPVASTDDPALVIRATEAELESANYGRECEMASPLFESIKPLMPPDKHLQLAWIISRILGP